MYIVNKTPHLRNVAICIDIVDRYFIHAMTYNSLEICCVSTHMPVCVVKTNHLLPELYI